jgi:phosphatidate cytidylyltransferase
MPGENAASGPALAETASRWSDLVRRVLAALVLLPVALVCVWAGGAAFSLLVAAAGLVLAGEFVSMCGYQPTHIVGLGMMAIVVAASICGATGVPAAGLVLLFAAAAAVFLSRRGDHVAARFNLAMGFPYLGLAAVAVPWLRADPTAGWPNTLFILGVIWASDIGAYVIGRLAGGPKLAPLISPGKTWSGAAGGLLCAAFGGLAVVACVSTDFSPSHVLGLAIVLGLISQAGDLFESALKRHFGVKDSGRIIPGHGGLLDRLDALLAVAPVAALLALTAGRGVVLWR